ncbi:MAG: anhydro-N-acetylmuramic acid kinase [Candidatus Eremiobacteraeota bacterium]|nr:anhydro-N-acetylmuramic acid kinase [Candidatus Eremiobacteraeota bacterium]
MKALGLMSGTSLDGIDVAMVDAAPSGDGYALSLHRFETHPFADDLRGALLEALPPKNGSVALVAALHRALGEAFALAAKATLRTERVDYVACHGQTVWHDGPHRVTLQLGDAFALREVLGATVCYDFRNADCAAGGQGAPLVPFVDRLLFASALEDRVVLNVGGIANVTLLQKGRPPRGMRAFDTGPGNILLDGFMQERSNGEMRFDRGGELASRGNVDSVLLDALLADDYFSQRAPKTTGRERFGTQFLARHGERLSRMRLEDAMATLTELTALTVAGQVEDAGFGGARIIVSGGGARNDALLARIAARLPQARVELSDAMGIPAEAKEAMAFAVLGYETLRGRAANEPRATGASHAVPLGAIAPYRLADLLARVETECQRPSR